MLVCEGGCISLWSFFNLFDDTDFLDIYVRCSIGQVSLSRVLYIADKNAGLNRTTTCPIFSAILPIQSIHWVRGETFEQVRREVRRGRGRKQGGEERPARLENQSSQWARIPIIPSIHGMCGACQLALADEFILVGHCSLFCFVFSIGGVECWSGIVY